MQWRTQEFSLGGSMTSNRDYEIVIKDSWEHCIYSSLEAVMEYSRAVLVLEYHFLSIRTRNPRYSVSTRTQRSMYSVLGQKKRRVHEHFWLSLEVTNKMNCR